MGKRVDSHGSHLSPESLRLKIDALVEAFRSEQVRWLVSRKSEIRRNTGMSDEAYSQTLAGIIEREAERSMIISELRNGNGGTIKEVSSATNMNPKKILRHMVALMKRGSVTITGTREDEYLFSAVEPPE